MVKNVSSVGVNYNAIQARKLTSSNNLYNKSVPEDKVQFSSPAFKGAAMNKVVNDGAKAVTKKLPAALAAVLAFVGIKGLSKAKESGEEVVLQEAFENDCSILLYYIPFFHFLNCFLILCSPKGLRI